MSIYLISDLHLDADQPELLALLDAFLEHHAHDCRALYILGDLFESWVGDDDDSALAEHVAVRLTALSERGTKLYFQVGNRDFVLGPTYAARAGMQLLPELHLAEFHGQAVMLMHGDQLCVQDHAYQKFRTQVRDPQWQAHMLKQPLAVRQAFAAQARAQSRAHQDGQSTAIMDVDLGAVRDLHEAHPGRLLIHGHTHRPAVHQTEHGTRVVLGDWGPLPSFLRFTAERADLIFAGHAIALPCFAATT